MIGKVKLEYMKTEPEWAHTLLEVSANGFTTDLISNENKSFVIELDVEYSQVIATRQDDLTSSFSLIDDTSISEYIKMFNTMLNEIDCSTTIYTIPQEMSTTTPFSEMRTIIEEVAFDEEMLEVGFWPGDTNKPQPSFYVLAYLFLTQDLSNEPILPDKAYYSHEKLEFFLTLEDALSYDNPE